MIALVIILSVLCLLLAFALAKTYDNKRELSEAFLYRKPQLYEWHKMDDLPCPGSFVVCEKPGPSHLLTYGYVVGKAGEVVILDLPSSIKPPSVTIEPYCTPFTTRYYVRWSYMMPRLLPTQVLSTYKQRYETEYK